MQACLHLVFVAAALSLSGCASPGRCTLEISGAVEGTFGWCNVLNLVDESEVRVVADLLDSCPSNEFCALIIEFPLPASVPGEAPCAESASVSVLHPSFDDPATEEELQDGGAASFRDGTSCSIVTDSFDSHLLSGEPTWSGTVSATLQLNDTDERVDVSIEGAVPSTNEGFAIDSDPGSKR